MENPDKATRDSRLLALTKAGNKEEALGASRVSSCKDVSASGREELLVMLLLLLVPSAGSSIPLCSILCTILTERDLSFALHEKISWKNKASQSISLV